MQSCHKCQQSFEETDIIILNAEGDDLELMKERAMLRKTSQKKLKKKKLNDDTSDTSTSSEEKKTNEPLKKKVKKEDKVLQLNDNQSEAHDPAYKKAKSDYSVAKDPKASEVFKSIFTTHKSAAEQDRAHWVTYNPFYN